MLAWTEDRSKKDANYYAQHYDKYDDYARVNEFLSIPETLEAVNTKATSLLTTDVKTRKLIGVSRET